MVTLDTVQDAFDREEYEEQVRQCIYYLCQIYRRIVILATVRKDDDIRFGTSCPPLRTSSKSRLPETSNPLGREDRGRKGSKRTYLRI